MSESAQKDTAAILKTAVQDILKAIDQEREREIITRRFGLFDRRETLEQIGELLGITRERVRQLDSRQHPQLAVPANRLYGGHAHHLDAHTIRVREEVLALCRLEDVHGA
jgi:DNA-directed RNA polymerase sigma subunit (sigma70/sigma32)